MERRVVTAWELRHQGSQRQGFDRVTFMQRRVPVGADRPTQQRERIQLQVYDLFEQ